MQKHAAVVSATMIIAVVLGLATVVLAEKNPFAGTWKLNVAKSKFSPGPSPKSATVTIEAQDNGVKEAIDIVNADGTASHFEWAAKYDGKDYPQTGNPNSDTIALKKISANTVDSVAKKGGKEVGRSRAVVSKDGKTTTVSMKGKNPQGQDTSNVVVLDKQ